MAKNKKYYVVWVGAKPGIYESWQECQAQIMGYPQAKYKSFKSYEEAVSAYQSTPDNFRQAKASKTQRAPTKSGIIWASISVDAACSGNPGIMEYRGVETKAGTEIFRQGPFQQGTNNIGEFLAIVHALALLKKHGKGKVPIYSDSRTAMAWVRNKKVKTTLAKNKKNEQLFEMMDRAIIWLEENTYENPILKWETKLWGEIPADFGRK